MQQKHTRRLGLDLIRFALSFLVINTHMTTPGEEYTDALARVIVPLFCLITGYYYDGTQRKGKTKIQVIKMAKLLLYATLLPFAWDILCTIVSGSSLPDYLRYRMQPMPWIKFLLFNTSLFGPHLWYLSAALYSLILLLAADHFRCRQKLYPLIPVLLLANLVLGNYSVVLLGRRIPVLLTRNYLLFTLPFMLLGDWLRHRQIAVPNRPLWLIVIVSVAAIVLEKYFLLHNYGEFNQEFYLGTTFLACAIFLLVLQNEDAFHFPPLPFLSRLGKTSATTVYVIHYIVIGIMDSFVRMATSVLPWAPAAYYWMGSILVLIVCYAITELFHRILAKCRPHLAHTKSRT